MLKENKIVASWPLQNIRGNIASAMMTRRNGDLIKYFLYTSVSMYRYIYIILELIHTLEDPTFIYIMC